jgi:lathosterol oxidase
MDDEKRGARRRTWADKLDGALLALLTAAGLFHRENAPTYYTSLLVSFAALLLPVFAGAALVTFASTRAGTRIQGPRQRASLWMREAFESARAMYVAACLVAWPMTAWRLGRPTSLIWSIDGLGAPLWRVVLQMLLGVVVMDAWLYWKHRLLHTRLLFPLHKAHHAFRDPTAFASFAVAPFEALLTLWPILFLCVPQAIHWAPLYFGLVLGFVALNFYLHCGVRLEWVERVLPRVFLNTSAFHNVHHQHVSANYGEAGIVWDRICKTRLGDVSGTPSKSASTA